MCISFQFWMTNKPRDQMQRHAVCWGEPDNWAIERKRASQVILKDLAPEQHTNPLVYEVSQIKKKLDPEASRLEKEGKFVSIIICTQGEPTDGEGEKNSAAMKEFIQSLKVLSDLPVKIVFRLFTSDEKVLNFYKKVDTDLVANCDVLGNYWQEVSLVCNGCSHLYY